MPEKRTSLNLTPTDSFCLEEQTEISFDLKFRPDYEIYFGYIMRIITSRNENIDIVYNQRLRNFNFVIGENFSCAFSLDSAKLFGQWNNFKTRFDKKKQQLLFFLDNKLVCTGKANFSAETCYRLFFGTNDFEGIQTMDIPPMNIKDIRILNARKERYFFPLSETEGTKAADKTADKAASVRNPVWIKPRHQNWQQIQSFFTNGTPSVAFNEASETLYIISKDSLYNISCKNLQRSGIALSKSLSALPAGNQSFFNSMNGTLNNFYIDEKKVGSFDPGLRKWNVQYESTELTEFWHANKFFSPLDTSLYILAGYGQLQYKNLVQRYHYPSKRWEIIKPKGDNFTPRYMAALGVNRAKDTAYILGGYGSNTGDQTMNPKFIYELLTFNVRNQSFRQVYHLKEPQRQFCFANSLVIDETAREYYALIYPTDRFNSSLQLIKGSLSNPKYELMGDSIPYSFYDIKSFADLYFAPDSKKLIAVTMYTSKVGVTNIQVYTLDFPPNPIQPTDAVVKKDGNTWWIFLLMGLALLLGMVAVYVSTRKRPPVIKTAETEAEPAASEEVTLPPVPVQETVLREEPVTTARPVSAVFLFGQLEIFDKNGEDITKQFTPLVKELFLLLLTHSIKDGRGISTDKIYEMLWSDKSAKDARNNYSVNLAKLKGILDKVGEYHITREADRWKFEIPGDSIQVDYQKFVTLTSGKPIITKDYITALIEIIHRGGFLPTLHYNWVDDLKSDVSTRVIDILLGYIHSLDVQKDAEFVVRLSNYIFYFDQLSEEALLHKCAALIHLGRHGMARDAYQKFSKEYADNYGHPFEKSFSEITGHG